MFSGIFSLNQKNNNKVQPSQKGYRVNVRGGTKYRELVTQLAFTLLSLLISSLSVNYHSY